MIRNRFLSVAVLLVLLFATAAEAVTVRGRVLQPDGRAYSGAAVVFVNTAIGATATVYTAEDGVFNLRNVPPGAYTMKVKTARAAREFPVSVAAQATVNVADVRVP